MKNLVYVVYANYEGCVPTEWMVYDNLRSAEIGAACARNKGMDAFVKVEEE